jgi:hypothetical protein
VATRSQHSHEVGLGALRVTSTSARGEAAVTTYDDAERQLAEAQAVLSLHATSSATGLCRVCGIPGPCYRRETAMSIFSRYHRLPRRIPGLSKPELVGARRVA